MLSTYANTTTSSHSSFITPAPTSANNAALSVDDNNTNGSYCQSMLTVYSSQKRAWSDYVYSDKASAWLSFSSNQTFSLSTEFETFHDGYVYTSTLDAPAVTRTDGALQAGMPTATMLITEGNPNKIETYTDVRTNTPWPPTWACAPCEKHCTVHAPEVLLIYFPVLTSNQTAPPGGPPATAIADGYTYTSGSAYLSFSALYAIDDCRRQVTSIGRQTEMGT